MLKTFTVGIALALAATLLTGCIVFKGPIRGKQISAHRVQVKFAICAELEETGQCYVPGDPMRGNVGETESKVLLGFRVPKGTGVPRTFESRAGAPFERSPTYTSELTARAPSRDSQKWVGYIALQPNSEENGPFQARFRVRFRLPGDPGRAFKYRPVVGAYNGEPFGDVVCGPDMYDNSKENPTLCIANPNGDRGTRRNLKIPLD